MAANSVCKQCAGPFNNGVGAIGCEGFCSNFYHIECIEYSIDELLSYRKLKNVWWICEECRIIMKEIRNCRSKPNAEKEMDSSPSSTHTKIDELDKELVALKEQMAEIHQTLAGVSSLSSVQTTGLPDGVKEDVPQAHSSMLSSSQLMYGTRKAGSAFCTSSSDLAVADSKYWLFLTKIKNSATEQDILRLINDCLGTNEAVIKKLVPAWKDTSSMTFISFKVGIGVEFKDVALRPSTWPAGLGFREFRENVWEPPQHDQQCTR